MSLKFKITTDLRHFEFEIQLCLKTYVSKCMCDKKNLLEWYVPWYQSQVGMYCGRSYGVIHQTGNKHVVSGKMTFWQNITGDGCQKSDGDLEVKIRNNDCITWFCPFSYHYHSLWNVGSFMLRVEYYSFFTVCKLLNFMWLVKVIAVISAWFCFQEESHETKLVVCVQWL